MAREKLSFKIGNTWTPIVTVTAPFSLDGFTAVAGLYDKPSRTEGTEIVPMTATVVATVGIDGGTIELILSAADQEVAIAAATFYSGTYHLAVQLNRSTDGYVHEIDSRVVTVESDIIT